MKLDIFTAIDVINYGSAGALIGHFMVDHSIAATIACTFAGVVVGLLRNKAGELVNSSHQPATNR